MLPALVSIRKPACPTLVTCTNALSAGYSAPPSLMGRDIAGVPQALEGLDARRVRVDSVGVQQLALPRAGVVPRQRQHRNGDVGPPVGDAEVAEVDGSWGYLPLAGDSGRRRRSGCWVHTRRRGRPRAGRSAPARSPTAVRRTETHRRAARRAAGADLSRSPAPRCADRRPRQGRRPSAPAGPRSEQPGGTTRLRGTVARAKHARHPDIEPRPKPADGARRLCDEPIRVARP